MKIISTISDSQECGPLSGHARKWLDLKRDAVLPEMPAYCEGDQLADYRIEASIVSRQPLSILYQRAGARLEALYGQKLAGQKLDDLYNSWFRKKAYESYAAAIRDASPVYVMLTVSTFLKDIGYFKLVLPFGSAAEVNFLTYILPIDDKITKEADWKSLVDLTPWL